MPMYENRKKPPLTSRQFRWRLVKHLATAILVILISMFLGILGYVFLEGMTWQRAFLNSAMLLSGLGLAEVPETPNAQLFASIYAFYASFIILVVSGIVVAPILHRLLHKFHWDGE